jgi:predicted MPP superfamily phosphohydrolase
MMARLFIVLGVMAFVLLLAAALAAAQLVAIARGRPLSRGVRSMARASWALTAVGLGCFLYGRLIEADWLEVKVEVVRSSKLHDGQHLTIALLSDLHVKGDTRALVELEKTLRELHPDLLIFAGDALNAKVGLERFHAVLRSADARLGRFAVRGNHDVQPRWRELDLFGDGVATELKGSEPVVLDDARVALCGAPFLGNGPLSACLAKAPDQALKILVYHSPDLIERLDPRPDLYLAGHTHGGQVRAPLYGAIVTFSDYDKKYEMGRYEVQGTTLYVNRGIGFEPWAPAVRFLARPELTIIQVVPQ